MATIDHQLYFSRLKKKFIFRTGASQGEGDKHLHGRNQSIITHQPCGPTAEKTVPLCKRCYLGEKKEKKRGSVAPCQNQQLQFCSSTVGGHSETTVRKRVVEVLLHVLMLAELPVSAPFHSRSSPSAAGTCGV